MDLKNEFERKMIYLWSLFLGTTSTTVLFVNLAVDNTTKLMKKLGMKL